jgi:tRNA(Ile)-lysidine synthase
MVSGGSDSVALARLLPRVCPGYAYTILHINHQLRGEDADGDERFVRDLARDLKLPCEVRCVDVAALAAAQTNGNVEEVGRAARYQAAEELLDELCQQAGYALEQGRVATAHTRDDRAETLLMRLVVGGGASGLSSIPFVNGRTIRPLLDCTRAELREWLRAESGSGSEDGNGRDQGDAVFWREDETNWDTRHLRAFVRHEVIPLLESRNPQLLATVARSLDVLADESAYLQQQADELFAEVCESKSSAVPGSAPEGLTLNTSLFNADPVLVRRVIREACRRVMPSTARVTFKHIENIAAHGRHIGFATDIPGDVTVRNVYGTLIIRRKTAAEKPKHDPRRTL